MTPAEMDEARRWTSLRGWRWMPGMRAVTPMGDFAGRLTEATLGIARPVYPDLTDPATRGCLLALAREITGRRELHAYWMYGQKDYRVGWEDDEGRQRWEHRYWPTETSALLAACEAHEREVAA